MITKTRDELNPLPPIGVEQTDLTKIGYKPPAFPDGVSIKSYQLKSAWKDSRGDNADKFQVAFVLQKDIHTSTETDQITITAKSHDLTTAKGLIKDTSSTKMKDAITLPDAKNKPILTASEIGYRKPIELPPEITLVYKLIDKQEWDTEEKFKIEVTLRKIC